MVLPARDPNLSGSNAKELTRATYTIAPPTAALLAASDLQRTN